jgi:3-isopropylmalate dehydrogenase
VQENTVNASNLEISVVRGEGVGPSVIDATIQVLEAAVKVSSLSLDFTYSPDFNGYDESARRFFQESFSLRRPVITGACGGRFVYDLRKDFELAYKFTPLVPEPSLADATIIRPERLVGVDILMVRDNLSGFYQGEFDATEDFETARQTAAYKKSDVVSLMQVTKAAAKARSGKLTVVTKPGGVPTISELWRQAALEVVDSELELEFLEVDNAAYQLVADPKRFDVVVAPNMFGDILGDTGSLLLASRGMSYSANFSFSGDAVYQTAHGAAHDLAGKNSANPIGQVLSAAWMLEREFGLTQIAQNIRLAIGEVLSEGFRTADVAAPGSKVLGTVELTEKIIELLNRNSND